MAYNGYIEKLRKQYIKEIDNIKSKDEIINYLKNEMDIDELYDSAYRELTDKNSHTLNLKDMKEILIDYQNVQLDYNDELNQEFLLGFSRSLADTVSLNFDIFYMHVTSQSYINMLKRNLKSFSQKKLDDISFKNMIEEFFKDPSFSSTTINIVKNKDLAGNTVGTQYGDKIQVVEGYLDNFETVASHELLHHFDENFLKFFSKKIGINLEFPNVSFLSNSQNPELIGSSNIPELKSLFVGELKSNYPNLLKGSEKYKTWEEAGEGVGKYLTRPTEVLSYFNDIRSMMILEKANAAKYPSAKQVLSFARSIDGQESVHGGFLSLINSLDKLQSKYGEEAYDMLNITPSGYSEPITGDLALDFFNQYGV